MLIPRAFSYTIIKLKSRVLVFMLITIGLYFMLKFFHKNIAHEVTDIKLHRLWKVAYRLYRIMTRSS